MTRTELLRDVFVWAMNARAGIMSSFETQLQSQTSFAMRLRNALIDVSVKSYGNGNDPPRNEVHALAERLVEPHDVPRFVELVTQDFRRINEGNIARYRIRLADYWAWLTRSRRTLGAETFIAQRVPRLEITQSFGGL